MRRIRVWIATSAVAVLVAGWGPARGAGTITHPFVGVTYVDRLVTSPRAEHTHVVQVDLRAPGIRVELSPHAGPRETLRQTTVQFLADEHAQVAINAHFFLPFPSHDRGAWLVGFAASDGRVFSAFETPEQRFALVADAPALNIDRDNHASIVHADAAASDGRHVREHVPLWTALAGSAQIVTNGAVTIPAYRDAAHPDGALRPGGDRHYSNANSWYDVETARTAIGVSRDGRTLTLFTVDARGGSTGMRVAEVAATLIREYDVWNALNLDGGGSTSLAMQDPATGRDALVNTSSDSVAGRSVGSSLAVFARVR
ncbi:MAG TPA: phosphodiester glycosidase family protein [Vicinamibacterales bacterium]|nr:phosphodiester glycosidase family protein [Vicinamibacterales bacterium]